MINRKVSRGTIARATAALVLSIGAVAAALYASRPATPTVNATSTGVLLGQSTAGERFDTFADAVRAADAVVLAKVVATSPGRTVQVSGTDLAFTNVTFSVMDVAKGTLRAGDRFLLEQTGGMTARGPLIDGHDPPYTVGEQDVLLLHVIPGGYRSLLGVGRYRVTGSQLEPQGDAAIALQWRGKSVAEILGSVRIVR